MSDTPNHSYNTPEKGTENWHGPLNKNFDSLDVDVELRDEGPPSSNNYQPVNGAKYLDTVTGLVYLADGNTWSEEFDLTGGGGGSISSLSGGDGINPGVIGDGDTLSVAWSNATSLDATGAINNFSLAADLDSTGAVNQLSGSVTGGQTLTDIAGNNLSIDTNGTLNASGSGGGGISSLSGGDGINPANIGDGDTLSVAWGDATGLDSSGNVSAGRYMTTSGGTVDFVGPAEWNNGGDTNTNTASGSAATVGGGFDNEATANKATVAGGERHEASGQWSTVGGGDFNVASATEATVAGGYDNDATGNQATVGGGELNEASNLNATVAGGNTNEATGANSTVGGGTGNDASGRSATVAGGNNNLVEGFYGTIGGGAPSDLNNRDVTRNVVYDDYGTIGGGGNNQAGSDSNSTTDATYATVSGGRGNTASGEESVVGGGKGNFATGEYATIAGGSNNEAIALGATVGGGGGVSNPDANRADGEYSTVPGGAGNTADGNYSTALGRNATASNNGAFVIGDSTNTEVTSQNADEARFQGEVVSESFIETGSSYYFTDSPFFLETFADGDTDNDVFSISTPGNFFPVTQFRVNEFGDTVVTGDLEVQGEFNNTAVDGDLEVQGNKNFVQPVETDDGEKEVVYTASEAAEARTEASGVANLEDGRVVIELPDHFAWVTSEAEPLVVQTTPYASEAVQPQVTERSTDRIVIEDFAGVDEYEVAYTVKGTRAGHEDKQVVREPTATGPSPTPADDD